MSIGGARLRSHQVDGDLLPKSFYGVLVRVSCGAPLVRLISEALLASAHKPGDVPGHPRPVIKSGDARHSFCNPEMSGGQFAMQSLH